MAVITFNKKYLIKLLSIEISEEKLLDQITKLGLGIEEVTSDQISIEVTPNRPDLFSTVGLARALKNFMHRSKKLIYEITDEKPALEIDVGKEVLKVRPVIASLAVYNVKLDKESLTDIINFTEKLCETYGRARRKIAIGLHDLDQIEPPLHYNAYEDTKFVPLNEKKEKYFSEVLKSTEQGMKYGYTLEESGKRYPALKDNLGILSFIPILNSERTRVTTSTKNILVDMTGMYEQSVHKTADLLAAMFMDLGADVKRVAINYPTRTEITPGMEKRYVSMGSSLAEAEIGVPIGYNNVISLGNKMGYEAALIGNSIRFRIPEYRLDIINEQDVVEDIAIAYGYDFIQPVPIPSIQIGELEQRELLFEEASETMVGMGFSEMTNTYLTNEKANFGSMRITNISSYMSACNSDYIRLKNPKAHNLTMTRTWIIPSLLRNLGLSVHEKMPQKLFELDMVFYLSKKVPKEDYHIAAVYADPKSNFNNIKMAVEAFAYFLKIDIKIEKYEHQSFIDGRCARIMLEKEMIGLFGELHPEVLNNFKIEEPTSAFEIDLSKLI